MKIWYILYNLWKYKNIQIWKCSKKVSKEKKNKKL